MKNFRREQAPALRFPSKDRRRVGGTPAVSLILYFCLAISCGRDGKLYSVVT